MSCWVGEVERVIQHIRITVKGLRVGGVGHYRVGAGKTAYARHIKSCLVVEQPHLPVFRLPGKVPVGNRLVGRCTAVVAKGLH